MKIKIDLLSYTLIGSGEGAGIIDSDVVLDDFGFPYIPSRRIKGALKESAKEVCDILGINEYKIINSIFGKDGFAEGKLHIGNLYINDYEEIKEEIKNLKNDNDSSYNPYKNFINSLKITSYYTTIRQQTSLEEDSEIAKEGSLRTIRVLKPNLQFEGNLYEIVPLTEKEKALIYLAVINLKRIGTSRNRGFGEIKCVIEGSKFDSLDNAINDLLNNINNVGETKYFDLKFNVSKNNKIRKLSYKITTLSPILIAKETGEQNTIYTENYIPSTTVRGLFANKFIRELNLGKTAHEDDDFYNLFLKGDIIFTSAYSSKNNKIYYPALYLHKEKGNNANPVYNILEKIPENIKTKSVNKMIYYSGDKIYFYDASTTFYFHNTRDRERGHSTGEEIFYYEAINEGEEFRGFIIGDEGYLKEIKKLFGEKFNSFIGRSKSAQYGLVKIEFDGLEDTDMLEIEDNEFNIVAISPIILYNEYGFSDISEKTLKNYLEKYFNDNDIIVKKIIARTEHVENFVGIWGMKNTRELVYSPGSAFKIRVEGCNYNLKEKLNNILIYGFGEKTDLGFGRVKIYWDLNEKYYIDKEKEKFSYIHPQKSYLIISDIASREIKEFIKYKGFERARDFENQKKISNNLIARIEEMLFETDKFNDWKGKLKELEKKPAGETLKDINLWEDLYELDVFIKKSNKIIFYDKLSEVIRNLSLNIDKFELSKTYWISFFRYLRLFKKQEEKKNE
ncbi:MULTISPECIES: RAMP superfamily CRISPR-associated protein [Thermoanaerobacterium]|uniref:CRISPR type III-associated protein domain-containing protein n=2 Tax=Thermoanaerobacterium TaxID=28895 RepID=W9EDX0_9THEO|nr:MULTISPECIES: RAMP superfamily CRISPR-associated protein [Thermoanaerobacterium]AFK85857.1 protein of unknown function DUF324 [Thermoanaerobacterium saccharolyticum JW/SL-YS485]ETO37934.1 hypothetical protein V518_1800 [Thermoanaerobacterium aotearoense SCUT27]